MSCPKMALGSRVVNVNVDHGYEQYGEAAEHVLAAIRDKHDTCIV